MGWLPSLQIGIVVQLEAEEAHRPLHRLTVTGWFLLSLLATSTALMIAVSVYSERLRQSFVNVAEQLDEFGQYTHGERISERPDTFYSLVAQCLKRHRLLA